MREGKSNNNSALGRDLIARVKSGGKTIKQLKLDELKLISLALGHTIVVTRGKPMLLAITCENSSEPNIQMNLILLSPIRLTVL